MSGAAPELEVSAWFNTLAPVTLEALRGRVVVLHAFQMLCPGCVSHGIPQAKAIRGLFRQADVAVIGLHSVFEHHAAMNDGALAAFLHEYRIDFPVAVDRPSEDGPVPRTMRRYGLQGTPSLLLFDRAGRLRHTLFGRIDDLRAGALIGQLLAEAPAGVVAQVPAGGGAGGCDADGCRLPVPG
jgi:peroxiredoxin